MKKQLSDQSISAPRDTWREIIRQDPNALITHTPEWIDAICRSDGVEDASRLYEISPRRQILLPAVRYKSLSAFKGLKGEKSLPHGWGVGGPVAAGGVSAEEIAQLTSELLQRRGILTSIRPSPLMASRWKLSVPAGVKSQQHITHILNLEGGFEQVWSGKFNSATRNKIRKAEKSGLTLEKDTTGKLLPEFYRLYLEWSERRGRERHIPAVVSRRLAEMREPYSKFEAVVNTPGDGVRLWVAWLGDQMVAAAYLLVWGEHAIYWRSTSDKELTQQTRANDLLQKVMIEDACQAGCRYYHMGESGGVESLMHFKSRFGGEETPYEEYFFGKNLLNIFQPGSSRAPAEPNPVLVNRNQAHETRADD